MRTAVVLPAPFGPRSPSTLADGHLERHAAERGDVTEPLDETVGDDRVRRRRSRLPHDLGHPRAHHGAPRRGATSRRRATRHRRRGTRRAQRGSVGEVCEPIARDVVGIGERRPEPSCRTGDERAERGRVRPPSTNDRTSTPCGASSAHSAFAEDEIERLRRGVGDEPVAAGPGRARRDEQDAAAPTLDHRRARSGGTGAAGRRSCAAPSRPSRRRRRRGSFSPYSIGARVVDESPTSRPVGRVDEHRSASGPTKSSGTVRASTPASLRIADASAVERVGPPRHEHDVHALRCDLARERRPGSFRRARHDRPRPVPVSEVAHGPSP